MLTRMTVAALVALLFALPLYAQNEPVQKIAPVKKISELERRIDIDFAGGTILQLLEVIEKTNGIKPNVIVSKEAAHLNLPPVKLQAVTVAEAIVAVEKLEVINETMIRVNETPNVLTVVAYDKKKRQEKPKAEPISQVFDTRSLTSDEFGVVDIVTAIKATWEMMGFNGHAQVKYHEETKLLIVVGPRHALIAASDLMSTLQNAEGTKAQSGALQKRIMDLENAFKTLQKENEEILRRISKLSR